jgi:hypothetical protein
VRRVAATLTVLLAVVVLLAAPVASADVTLEGAGGYEAYWGEPLWLQPEQALGDAADYDGTSAFVAIGEAPALGATTWMNYSAYYFGLSIPSGAAIDAVLLGASWSTSAGPCTAQWFVIRWFTDGALGPENVVLCRDGPLVLDWWNVTAERPWARADLLNQADFKVLVGWRRAVDDTEGQSLLLDYLPVKVYWSLNGTGGAATDGGVAANATLEEVAGGLVAVATSSPVQIALLGGVVAAPVAGFALLRRARLRGGGRGDRPRRRRRRPRRERVDVEVSVEVRTGKGRG